MTATAVNAAPTAPAAQGWQAELQLRFVQRAGRTVLTERKHIGPLLVQRPFYPEHSPQGTPCHIYLIHPPGGVVGGDQLTLNAQVDAGAHALITTPAATKFYRAAPGRVARVTQTLRMQAATLEWLPQEAIYFNHAAVRTTTRIHLDRSSRFIGWELACYGRLASQEVFSDGSVHQGLELWLDDTPLLLDHLYVAGGADMQQAAWGLRGMTALGTLLAFPATSQDVDAVRDSGIDATQLSCTLIDGALLCRCLSADSTQLKAQLLRVWQVLRPRLLQRDAVAPRIWAT